MTRLIRPFALVAILLFGGLALAGEESVPTNLVEVLSGEYFAPANQIFYRLRYADGSYREFERDMGRPALMQGAKGWRAVVRGSQIVVESPKGEGRMKSVFDRGRLVSRTVGQETVEIPYEADRLVLPGVTPPFLFGTMGEQAYGSRRSANKQRQESLNSLFVGKWSKSGRLCWPFMNPNENGLLYGLLAMLFLALTVFSGRTWQRVVCAGLLGLFGLLLVWTVSRGTWLAFAAGVAVAFALSARRVFTRANLVVFGSLIGAFLLVSATAYVAIGPKVVNKRVTKMVMRGFRGKSSWSNQIRYDMWRTAPRMMLDAPDGWGKYNIGKAFIDWYEDVDVLTVPGSLMNDHLTRMVRYGSWGRYLYVYAWAVVLLGLGWWGYRRKNGFPCGGWLLLGVAAWFSPLLGNLLQWIVPVLLLVPVAADMRRFRAKPLLMILALALLPVGLSIWLVHHAAAKVEVGVPVRVTPEGALTVRGPRPRSWVVDDGATLGGVFTCKEIRSIYLRYADAPSVGYAPTLDNLPKEGVVRLVLGGMAGDAWLRRISQDEAARRTLPREVIFLSPPFPPSAVPQPLLAATKVKYVTGEFNARYFPDEFRTPPGWVEVIPSMELYIANWMRYALSPL